MKSVSIFSVLVFFCLGAIASPGGTVRQRMLEYQKHRDELAALFGERAKLPTEARARVIAIKKLLEKIQLKKAETDLARLAFRTAVENHRVATVAKETLAENAIRKAMDSIEAADAAAGVAREAFQFGVPREEQARLDAEAERLAEIARQNEERAAELDREAREMQLAQQAYEAKKRLTEEERQVMEDQKRKAEDDKVASNERCEAVNSCDEDGNPVAGKDPGGDAPGAGTGDDKAPPKQAEASGAPAPMAPPSSNSSPLGVGMTSDPPTLQPQTKAQKLPPGVNPTAVLEPDSGGMGGPGGRKDADSSSITNTQTAQKAEGYKAPKGSGPAGVNAQVKSAKNEGSSLERAPEKRNEQNSLAAQTATTPALGRYAGGGTGSSSSRAKLAAAREAMMKARARSSSKVSSRLASRAGLRPLRGPAHASLEEMNSVGIHAAHVNWWNKMRQRYESTYDSLRP